MSHSTSKSAAKKKKTTGNKASWEGKIYTWRNQQKQVFIINQGEGHLFHD